jgi:hypothetical protein
LQDSENKLPVLKEEVFDGEKFSVEVKETKCKHDVELIDDRLVCKKCKCGWEGPQISRLYEEFKKQSN